MKTKDYYKGKIEKAKQDIQKWELAIELLDKPVPLRVPKEATKIVSVRVEKSKAEIVRLHMTQFVQTL